MNKSITNDILLEFKKNFNDSKKNKIVANAVQKNGVLACAYNLEEGTKLTNIFNVEVKDMVSITDQKASGRCWMFSGLNVLRKIISKKLGIKDIDLSQTYLFFYDKLEKANNMLELAIKYIEEDKESRIFQSIFNFGPDADGGYWHQFKDLVKKYGICPQVCQPETYSSGSSREMDHVLNVLISKDIDTLKNLHKDGKDLAELRKAKEEMLNDFYRVLAICLGQPVDKFVFEYKKDKDKKDDKDNANNDDSKEEFVRIESTPIDFFNEYVGSEIDNYVSLVNYPSNEYPYYKKYNNIGATPIIDENYFVLNCPIDELKNSAIKSLKDNMPMWFACDVTSQNFNKEGVLSTEAYAVEDLFDIKLDYDKFERLRYHSSEPNHAMTLVGVNIEKDNKPSRWKIQNSWGTDFGKKGFFVMSDSWFDQFMYEVIVDKKYLSDKAKAALDGEVITLNPWDPIA